MRKHMTILVALAMPVCVSSLRAEVVIETITVGNPGNLGEWSGEGVYIWANLTGYGLTRICGAVNYTFEIAKYEVTAAQYTEFLNAVAATDTYGLYNTQMWDDQGTMYHCNIFRSGEPGSYTYQVLDPENWANRPVAFVAWSDAVRFANWMHNGQPTGAQGLTTTEDGSYFLNGATTNPELKNVVRRPGATWVLPSEDEWYKAAFHMNDGPTGNYWDYATQHGTLPSADGPSNDVIDPDPGDNANFWVWPMDYSVGPPYFRNLVGEFENSGSSYGTFDQSGNQWEWTDSWPNLYGNPGTKRALRGGSFYPFLEDMYNLHAAWRKDDFAMAQLATYGFRLAKAANDCNGNGTLDQIDLSSGTSHDYNYNGKPDECDIAAGTSLDCNVNGIPDEAEVGAVTPPAYQWDDDGLDIPWGMTDGGYLGWLNHFAVVPGRETVGAISIAYDTDWIPVGAPLTVFLWSDPNKDGNPADAVVLASAETVVTSTASVVDIPDTYVGPVASPSSMFFVGALMTLQPGWYPAAQDMHSDHQTSWLVSSVTAPIDPNNLAAPENSLATMADFGWPGNWLVRAIPAPAVQPNDANQNGIPDDCEQCVTQPGDLDHDNDVDGDDIQGFAMCFLQGPGVTPPCLCADMNLPLPDMTLDEQDIALFVARLLEF